MQQVLIHIVVLVMIRLLLGIHQNPQLQHTIQRMQQVIVHQLAILRQQRFKLVIALSTVLQQRLTQRIILRRRTTRVIVLLQHLIRHKLQTQLPRITLVITQQLRLILLKPQQLRGRQVIVHLMILLQRIIRVSYTPLALPPIEAV